MSIISKGLYKTSNTGGDSEFKNPKSIWRNTVRIKDGEYALIKFISDLDDGDVSRFHSVRVQNRGDVFTNYVYCPEQNLNEFGRIIDDQCPHCASTDVDVRKTGGRYLFWVFHYGTYHLDQNPYAGKYDDAKFWDKVETGKASYYRETVFKPQLLIASFTLFKDMESLSFRQGTLKSRLYEYTRTNSGRISYSIMPSDQTVQNTCDTEIEDMANDLPDLEKIAAKLITEVDLPSFAPNTTSNDSGDTNEDAEVFKNMANIVVEET